MQIEYASFNLHTYFSKTQKYAKVNGTGASEIMKIYTVLMVMLVALAGCSTSLKGSVGAAGNQDASKNGNSVASSTATNQSAVVAGN